MATETKPDIELLAKIRIPAEYLASLDGAFGFLKRRIVEHAATRAARQVVGVVTREDVLRSVQAVFPAGAPEFEKALADHESNHAGIA